MAILGYNKFDLAKFLETRRLAGWLEIATDDLEAPARQRVAQEIGTHYADAVTAHMAAGAPEFSAQAAALAELGNPKVAAVNFQKIYLTGSEAKWIQSWERIAAKPLFSSSMLLWDVVPIAALALLPPHPQWIMNFRLLAIVVLMAYVVFRLVPRLLCASISRRIYFLRALAFWSSLPLVAVGLAFSLFFYKRHDPHGIFDFLGAFNAALYFYLYSYRFNLGIRIWNKLRKAVVTAESWRGKSPDKIVSS